MDEADRIRPQENMAGEEIHPVKHRFAVAVTIILSRLVLGL